MMHIVIRKLLFLFVLLGCCFVSYSQTLIDGPYVLYKGDSLKVLARQNGELNQHILPLKKKHLQEIRVSFPAHSKWDFSVRLKPKLVNEQAAFAQPERLFFVSDIEGEFAGFRALLILNKVIDEQYRWTFGKGHLVICGDLFDRGSQVTECLWLLYKLEQEARKNGGYVHTILGNHDIMNLSGDLRYLQPKYLEGAKLMGMDYMKLYDQDSELGRWLRTKNVMERIGDNLCLHAGVSPEVTRLGLSLKQINALCRPYYDQAKGGTVADTLAAKFFSGTSSPFWYRGYFSAPKATEAEVDASLSLFEVSRIVVGHTIVPSNIGFYYSGKVLGIDINRHEGDNRAVLFEKGIWTIVDDQGNRIPLKK